MANREKLSMRVVGLPAGQGIFEYADGGPDWHAPLAALPTAEVEADQNDSLRSVLQRGAEALRVSLTPSASKGAENRAEGAERDQSTAEQVIEMLAYAAFRQEDDDERSEGIEGFLRRDTPERKHTVLVVRDSQGRAIWRRPPFEATVGELVDAHEAGLLEGDPLCPYLVLVIPQGEIGLLGEWSQFQQQLDTAWRLTGALATIAGALSGIEWVKKRLARHSGEAAEVVKKNAPDWSSRGAAPEDLRSLIASRPRRTEEIASLLGCSENEAEAILWALGFAPRGPEGTWVL